MKFTKPIFIYVEFATNALTNKKTYSMLLNYLLLCVLPNNKTDIQLGENYGKI